MGGPNREDHPEDLIRRLQEFPTPVKRRQDLVEYLTGEVDAVARLNNLGILEQTRDMQ